MNVENTLKAGVERMTAAGGEWAAIAANVNAARQDGKRTGTVKKWVTERDGSQIDTVQWRSDGADGARMVWAPGRRPVTAFTAGAVCLSDSWRDFAGTRVVCATDETIIFSTKDEVVVWSTSDLRKMGE